MGPDRALAAALAAATRCAGGGALQALRVFCLWLRKEKLLQRNKHFKPAVGAGRVEASRIVAQEAQDLGAQAWQAAQLGGAEPESQHATHEQPITSTCRIRGAKSCWHLP